MPDRVIDSNVLFPLWRQSKPAGRDRDERSVRAVARSWLELQPNDVILTPVRLEFLGGVRSKDELKLADIFLDCFPLADNGRVLPEDWKEAERLARRVPHDGRPRGAIDCIIVAVCNRLRLELRSDDAGLPRRGR